MSKYIALAEILMDVEKELRELRLWESEPPSAEALASVQPFAVDTLNFAQWLQFIFIPRLYEMIDSRSALPVNCGVAPMAEEYFPPLGLNSYRLVEHLHEIDELLTIQSS